MRLATTFWLALPFMVPPPALAQQAQVMTFQTAGQGSLATKRAERDVPADEGSMGDRMAAGYSLLGIAPSPRVSLPSSSSIAVPAWMRAGRVAFGDATPTAPMPGASALACGASAYRPRPDLGWRAEARRVRLYPIIAQVACEAGVPVGLFDALVAQESRYNATALSPKGAIGLAQLMPGTASALGVRTPWDPIANLRGGARYLRSHLREFGRVDLALAAYNAGPGRIRKMGRVPGFRETRSYVATIIEAWAGAPRPVIRWRAPAPITPIAPIHSRRSAEMLTFAPSQSERTGD